MARTRFEKDGDLGIVTLTDGPLNLFGTELVEELSEHLENAGAFNLRALILRAEGECFSGGANVQQLFQDKGTAEARTMLSRFNKMLSRFEELPFPTLAVVQGMCLAAGLELVLACDMAWAAESVQFGLVEAVIGTTPLGGGSQRMAERCGPARAREITMTAGFYTAEQFERWNIINRVLPDAELEAESLRFGKRLAAGPTSAHAATKRIVREYLDHGIRAADQLIPDLCAPLFETRDMKQGIESLLKDGPGKAVFSGI